MSTPLIENKNWQKAMELNESLKEAVMNPNTDFMTKLLFDARFFNKKLGKEITYWSNAIFALKLLLHEKKALDEKGIEKALKIPSTDLKEMLSYLKNMSEILEEEGKYSLNYANLFSKIFKE